MLAGWADEAAVVKMIKELGGRVTVDDKLPGKPVVEVDLNGMRVTDVELKEVRNSRICRSLD